MAPLAMALVREHRQMQLEDYYVLEMTHDA